MSDIKRGLNFETIGGYNDNPTKKLSLDFLFDKEFITEAQLKEYAQDIALKINSAQSDGEKKVILIDLLSDNLVGSFIERFINEKTITETDRDEVRQMSFDTIRSIRKKIALELKPLVSPELYYFIIFTFPTPPSHFNRRHIVSAENNNLVFLKDTRIDNSTVPDTIRRNLKKLSDAFAKLQNPNEEMPYVQKPEVVSSPVFDNDRVTHTTEADNFITIDEIFEQIYNPDADKQMVKDGLLAIADCMRGAKFLADNGLTLTDISAIFTGKNLGMDIETKKGILFDLDGLQGTGEVMTGLIAQRGNKNEVLEYIAPEYRKFINKTGNAIVDPRSMIWEFGHELSDLAYAQKQKLLMQPQSEEAKRPWLKLIKLAEKMMAKNPDDRPDFDTCIAELIKIVEGNFKENNTSTNEQKIQFTFIPENQDNIDKKFKKQEYLTREEIKKYTQKIIDAISKTDDPKQKQAVVINLLLEDEIFDFAEEQADKEYPEFFEIKNKKNGEEYTDFDEIKLMIADTIATIRKQVIEQLETEVDPELIFFVKEYFGKGHFSDRMIVSDRNKKEQFLKKYTKFFNRKEAAAIFRKNLKALQLAFEKLDDPEEMPYIIRPTIIDNAQAEMPRIMVDKKDLYDIKNIIENKRNEFSLRDILQAIIDCLKGAKFLAKNNLVLTDISPQNIGIDKATGKGILFDLDCVLRVGDKITFLIEPGLTAGITNWTPPEYAGPIIKKGAELATASAKSMIWEIGNALEFICDELEDSNHPNARLFRITIESLKTKMKAKKPEDRPDFDTCIAELTKIIEEKFKD